MLDQQQWVLGNKDSLISLEKWQRTVNLLSELFDAPAGFLVQYTEAGFQVTIASQQESNPYPAGGIIDPDANIFCRKIVENGEALYVKDAPLDPCWDTNTEVTEDGFRSYLGVPVHWPDGSPFGTFCVMDFRKTNYSDTYIKLIHQLRDILEADLELIHAYENLHDLAMSDELTNLYNRRGYRILAEQRLKLAHRMEVEVGMLYLDLDEFKTVNDQHGHEAGDNVLVALADAIRDSVRDSDIVGRIGGDEFTALVMVKDPDDFEQINVRIRSNLLKNLKERDLPQIEVSAGYALMQGLDIDELLSEADQAMYRHKQTKR
jgi:diguanylate cyclase (GGDEF)-like protein